MKTAKTTPNPVMVTRPPLADKNPPAAPELLVAVELLLLDEEVVEVEFLCPDPEVEFLEEEVEVEFLELWPWSPPEEDEVEFLE
jgi:hypothetical protein